MNPVLIAHIISNLLCFILFFCVLFQTVRHVNKIRICILTYSLFTLPVSIVNTLAVQSTVSSRANSLSYLVSTLLMGGTHIVMMMDVGYRLRSEQARVWRHPLVIIGVSLIVISCSLMIVQIVDLAIAEHGTKKYPIKPVFIAGVITFVFGDGAIFTFTFLPLLYWKQNKSSEQQQKTIAIGIWFFLAQNAWYVIYGGFYLWFFIMNSWDHFSTLLAFDYVLRFGESLIYAWPPPAYCVQFISDKIATSSVAKISLQRSNGMSSERYNQLDEVGYQNNKELENINMDRNIRQNRGGGFDDSKVTIISKK